MAFDFPASPATGTVQTGPNGAQWRWDGTKWLANAAWQTASLVISDTPPANPAVGALWFDSIGLATYTWFNDGTSSQWTPVVNQGGVTDAPLDGQYYVRRNGVWANVAQAPSVQNNTGRNLIHNGQFNVWQRGAGPFTATGYTADRWQLLVSLDSVTAQRAPMTVGQATGVGDEGAVYSYAANVTGNAGAGSYTFIAQYIEGVRRLSGKTVTVSFYAWASAGGSPKLGVGLRQSMGTGGSPSANVDLPGQAVTLNGTAPTRFSVTFNVPSLGSATLGTNGDDSTRLSFCFSSGTTNGGIWGNPGVQTATFVLWGIQLEIGSVATPLAVRDPADELALCQRFYCTFATRYWQTYSYGTGLQTYLTYFCPVTMRAAPSVTVTSSSANNVTSVVIGSQSPDGFQVYITCTNTGGTGTTLSNITASADL